MVTRCLLVLSLLAASPAGATSQNAPHSAASPPDSSAAGKFSTWRASAATVLAGRTDAHSLATAAALRSFGPPDQRSSAVDLAARASDLAPQNASIVWLHLQLCASTPPCDVRDVSTVMRWVDADNSAAWLQTLAAAQKERDSTDIDRVLGDMALGVRFDLYWNRIVVLLADTFEAAGNDLPAGFAGSDSARLGTALGIAGGEIIPPFAPLMEVCREPGATPERRESCLKLSKTMQHADTVVAQMAGYSLAKRLLPPDSKEARAVAERRRVLEWRMTESSKFDNALLPWTKNANARARLAQMRTLPREEDVCIAILKAHRVALEPPEPHP
jgi:hypothetical protein